MATYEKLANLKGPKGNGYDNARVEGDNLLMDKMDGTELVGTVTVGNVRGPKGTKGDDGDKGDTGETGLTPQITTFVETGAPGSDAQVWQTGSAENPELYFTLPRGDQGVQGVPGPVPNITFDVEPLPAGAKPTIIQTGTPADPYVRLGLPKGDQGETGPMPTLQFTEPMNLTTGSDPRVLVSQPQPGVYEVTLGLVQGEPGTASEAIKDDEVTLQNSWSSSKTQAEIQAMINDSVQTLTSGWSSQKISEEISNRLNTGLAGIITDNEAETSTQKAMTARAVLAAIAAGVAAAKPDWAVIQNKPATFPPSTHSHTWSQILSKPSSFTPSTHSHSASDVSSGVFSPDRLPTAEATVQGAVTLDAIDERVPKAATTEQVTGGTDNDVYVTPATLDKRVVASGVGSISISVSNQVGGMNIWANSGFVINVPYRIKTGEYVILHQLTSGTGYNFLAQTTQAATESGTECQARFIQLGSNATQKITYMWAAIKD